MRCCSTDRQTDRLDYVDICKAIGIILVILGHTYYLPKRLYDIIYCFHMPLFFVLAGFTYDFEKNRNLGFRKYAAKKAKHLMLPYILFAIINLVAQIGWKTLLLKEYVDYKYVLDSIKGILLCYSSMKYMPNCSPIWFLLCLFIASLFFWWIVKLPNTATLLLSALCMLISYLLSPYTTDYNSFPWKFPVFLMAVFLIYVGYALRNYVLNRDYTKKNSVVLVSCIAIILCFRIELLSENGVGMNENAYGNLFIFLLTGTAIPASMLLIFRNTHLKVPRQIIWLGKKTIYIVGFNYLCRDIATEIYYRIPIIRKQTITAFPMFVLTLITCIFCTYFCSAIVGRFKNAVDRLQINKNREII